MTQPSTSPNGQQPAVQVVHASPGRLRLRVRREAADDDTLARTERALVGLTGVRDVRANPLTRSVLVAYDDGVAEPAQVMAAVERAGLTVAPTPDQAGEGSGARAALDRTALSQGITDLFGAADTRLADLTGGAADLRTLVPVGFAVMAIRQLVTGPVSAVPWYALAWYAFDSFVKLRRTDTPTEPVED